MAAPGEPVLYSLFIYAPNKIAPFIFAIAFAISAVFHIWQCHRYKSWKLLGLHPLCAVLFTTGYALRTYGAHNYLYSTTTKLPLIIYILSQVFIYVCPPLLELSNYHVLAHLFFYVPYFSPLPPSRVLATFGGLMLIVELLNALGVALAANPSSSPTTQSLGGNLVIAAISLQVLIILIFICLAAVFHRRFSKAKIRSKNVNAVLFTLYGSMLLIFVRCMYRVVEHAGNTKVELDDIEALRRLSPLLRYEAYFYVFEAGLMLVNSVLWNIWHAGRYLPREVHVYLGRDGREVMGEKEVDFRSRWEKVGHVLSFGMLFRRKRGRSQRRDRRESL
ncbi:RTA1 domain-containing protein [Cladorrhinum sp. PSN332]|nr:RTA1 domain-containing protein [Cladorrhinum sp. PSN332]